MKQPDDRIRIRIGRGLFMAVLVASWLFAPGVALSQSGGSDTAGANMKTPAGATVETLYKDFLHYARMGRFRMADAYAKALLEHPELDPLKVLEVADQDKKSLNTLLIIIKNSTIRDSAAKVLELIHRGEQERRQAPDRIAKNIGLLGGNPQQEFFAQRQLTESGEYAIPAMVQTLLDTDQKSVWPRVINTLPMIGKAAVNPLVIALSVRNNDVRLNLIHALGEIGYSQALPYLHKLRVDESMPEQTHEAVAKAAERIAERGGRGFSQQPAELFYELADRYYSENDAVRADPRLPDANVWYWDDTDQTLRRVVVPQRIFGQVMALRCCEEAMRLRNDYVEAISLWVAANIRREGRLGFDVESGEPIEQQDLDPTRPDVFPRALYFSQTAGPRYAHRVLARAVRDHDSAVALGAIEALRVTAGESSLIGAEDIRQPLVRALQFPDLVVRIRAALALGAALPKSQFDGSQLVVPILASAVEQTGSEQLLVVDRDEASLNRVVGALRNTDREVSGGQDFFVALDRARRELPTLSGIFVSTDIVEPGLAEAWRRLRSEFMLAKTPLVVMIKPGQTAVAQELIANDPYAETVLASVDDDALEEAFARVRQRTGQAPFDADLAQALALQATETLRSIVADGRTVYGVGVAEPALIGALESMDERLQVLAASVLALLPAETAQRAVAHVALDDVNTDSLRIACFASLAESAKNHGNLLELDQIDELVDIAHNDDDLIMRTSASQSLGAINLKTNKASEIIRSYYGG